MIPFTSDEKIGYPVPIYSWKDNQIQSSKYATYYDPRLGVNSSNLPQQVLQENARPEINSVVPASNVAINAYPLIKQFPYMYDPTPKITKDILKKDVLSPVINYSQLNTLFQTPVGVTISNNWYEYDDVDSDPNLRNGVVRFFRDEIMELLKDSFSDLLNYFIVRKKDGKDVVDYNKESRDYDKDNKDSEDIKNKKIEFIRFNILSKKFIAKTLEHYTTSRQMKWWDLRKNKDVISNFIYDKLKQRIKDKSQ